jgi:hypothetical protein
MSISVAVVGNVELNIERVLSAIIFVSFLVIATVFLVTLGITKLFIELWFLCIAKLLLTTKCLV